MNTYSPEWHEHRKGLYQEEVQKIVDGVVEDVQAGMILLPNHLVDQLIATVRSSIYVNDNDMAAEVLRYAGTPCAGMTIVPGQPGPFPWRRLAELAMNADCIKELDSRREVDILFGH